MHDVFIITIDQKEIEKVNVKDLDVVLDFQLKFEAYIRKVFKTVKTNFNCFQLKIFLTHKGCPGSPNSTEIYVIPQSF